MPKLNETRFIEIGKSKQKVRHTWLACPRCNKKRWVVTASTKKKGYTGLCPSCVTFIARKAFEPYRKK